MIDRVPIRTKDNTFPVLRYRYDGWGIYLRHKQAALQIIQYKNTIKVGIFSVVFAAIRIKRPNLKKNIW